MSNDSNSRHIMRNVLLKPLSAAYGLITATRNKMFDCGVLTERRFDIPVVVVGNIAVGGTGKTPHTEYIIELLHSRYKIGVLSRGYNRRTKGFRLATEKSDANEIGDEPYQIYRKFSDKGVMVAVCEDRCKGIDMMRELDPELNLIVLDDAFQHRYVKPTVSVVLTEYSRPVFDDSMLPAGRLRENISGLHRADIVIVTKCPKDMKQLEYRLFMRNLNLYPYQKLFFSRYTYGALKPVFEGAIPHPVRLDELTADDTIVAVAGIANPKPFVRHLKQSRARIKGVIYSDHHNFNTDDISVIINKIKAAGDPARTIVITTEKDAMRLRSLSNLPNGIKRRLYYIPITVQMVSNIVTNQQSAGQEFAETLLRKLEAKES